MMNKNVRRKVRQRRNALMVALMMVLVAAVSIGGTMAWLTDSTGTVKNEFVLGNINIDLFEHTLNEDGTLKTGEIDITRTGITDYKVIPGVDLNKDPQVVVEANSEDCWLFVKVEESSNWPSATIANSSTRKVDYSVITGTDGWTALTDKEGVYYREVSSSTEKQTFKVLVGDKVTVSSELTKTEVDAISGNLELKFTAYAIQKAAITDVDEDSTAADEAWAELNK